MRSKMRHTSGKGLDKLMLAVIIFFLMMLPLTLGADDSSSPTNIPIGLQKIIDYNKKSTADFALKISFLIAFVAGILGILSPCILPFLPAYFSYTFKEKKNITKMTFVFFGGFSLVFTTMGVVAGFLGSQVLTVVQSDTLAILAGSFIIFFGLLSLLGKGFSSLIKVHHKFNNDTLGTFLLGVFFALGWTACLGPILAGILGIGAILNNIWHSALLLFFYSLGNLIPLFILSIFYDKLKLSNSKFIKGKIFKFTFGGKEFEIHSTNFLSGILFIALGMIIVIYKGTSVFNKYDLLGTKQLFYSIQDQLLVWRYSNYLGFILLVLFVISLGYLFWWRKRK